MYVYVCIYVYVCVFFMWMYVCLYMCVCVIYLYVYVYAYICMCMCICVCVCVCSCACDVIGTKAWISPAQRHPWRCTHRMARRCPRTKVFQCRHRRNPTFTVACRGDCLCAVRVCVCLYVRVCRVCGCVWMCLCL